MTPITITSLDANGEVLQVAHAQDEASANLCVHPAAAQSVLGAPPDDGRQYRRSTSGWEARPTQPSVHHVWRAELAAWVDPRTVEQCREAKWQQVKAARAAAAGAPLVVGGRVFDADLDSAASIAGAVQLASISGPEWTIRWTLADDSTVTLTAAEMIAVGFALGRQVNAAHEASRAIRSAINAATTVAAVDAIQFTGGVR